jgi:hypothetical protein
MFAPFVAPRVQDTLALRELLAVAVTLVGADGGPTKELTAMVRVAVACPEVAPVAVIVKVVAAFAAVGVPEITPVDELIDNPAGKSPPAVMA